jgi:hypothetical protein
MNPPAFRFRFWNTIARRYQPASMYALTGDGLLMGRDERWDWEPDQTPLDKTCVIVERWTGLKDRTGRDIFEGDLLVTENDHANGGDKECDDWTAEDMGVALVSIDMRWGIRMQTADGDVWSWDDEDSVYDLRFLRVVGNRHEGPKQP